MFYTIMNIVLNILNVFVLIKTLSFSIYEIKNNNKLGGVISIIFEILVFILILCLLWVK